MTDSRQRPCSCGRPADERANMCQYCLRTASERPQSRTRTGRSRYVSTERPSSDNRSSARTEDCRRSLDFTNLQSYREMSASAAFTHAFTSEPDDDEYDDAYLPGSVDLFPASIYRRPSRTPSRTSSSRSGSVYSVNAGPTPPGRSPLPLQAQPSESLARPVGGPTATRDANGRITNDRGYSPMAAGFARLSHKTSPSDSGDTARTASRDTSLATMDARMFAGPA